jgi:hypothetical protein
MLIHMILGEELPARHVLLQPELIVRESSGQKRIGLADTGPEKKGGEPPLKST